MGGNCRRLSESERAVPVEVKLLVPSGVLSTLQHLGRFVPDFRVREKCLQIFEKCLDGFVEVGGKVIRHFELFNFKDKTTINIQSGKLI